MPTPRRPAVSPDASLPPPRLTARGVGITALAYLALAAFYAATIAWAGREPIGGILGRVALDYAIKGALTVPLWWAIVRRLDGLGWKRLLAVHAGAAPLFVAAFYHAYYGLLPVVGLAGLPVGFRQWDVYIPTLLYVIQFGAFHTVRHVHQLNAQADRERELIDLAREREMAALKAQLNPHFLFNAFNAISASVPPELDATRTTIARMARLLRYTLKASDRDRVTLREELAFVRGYLALERHRFEERLTVALDVDDAALDVLIPPMLLQPLVENAVKHGIAPAVDGGTVRLAIRRAGDRVAITVADTGAGTDRPVDDLFRRGVGLRATDRRLNILHGAALRIETAPGDGFTVRFEVPAAPRTAPERPAAFAAGAQRRPADPGAADPASGGSPSASPSQSRPLSP